MRSSIASTLLNNSVKNRIVGQMEEIRQKFKQQQKMAAKGENFKTGFPMYYQMLAMYSDSRLFRSDSADKLIPKRDNLFENLSTIENKRTSIQNLTISYQETSAPNNFDHAVRPF